MQGRTLRYLAEYLLFRMVVCGVQMLSVRQTVAAAHGLAWFVHRVLPRTLTRYGVASENIRRALGHTLSDAEVDHIVYGMWRHLFRMVAEIIQLPRRLRLDSVPDVIEFRHRSESVRALSTGRPVILLSGHYGNWEMAMTVFGHFGFPMGVVARDLDNPYLHAWFERFRRHTGHELISKKGGGDRMVAFLERRGHLALLADQDAGAKGQFVDFFGHPASTFKSIALLAREYRALICVGYARRLDDDFLNHPWVRYEMGCEEIIDPLEFDGPDQIREITQQYTRALERAVRRSPEQYFWVHRRWKSVPRRRRKRQAA